MNKQSERAKRVTVSDNKEPVETIETSAAGDGELDTNSLAAYLESVLSEHFEQTTKAVAKQILEAGLNTRKSKTEASDNSEPVETTGASEASDSKQSSLARELKELKEQINAERIELALDSESSTRGYNPVLFKAYMLGRVSNKGKDIFVKEGDSELPLSEYMSAFAESDIAQVLSHKNSKAPIGINRGENTPQNSNDIGAMLHRAVSGR